jgi:putative radical SAM enzyme (TIGR03279 family)
VAVRIETVAPGSAAEALGLRPGDRLLEVDGNPINDTLDYQFYTDSPAFHLTVQLDSGVQAFDVRREERGPFGCEFETYLGDKKHSCANHCMFCFIDQLPPGMRESLYFKDDDERLSFLFGNYITMTNMHEHEIDRIIKMHISPINVSVHTTNPTLRVRMLANKRGGETLAYLDRLVEGGIAVNCQLVLCRGVNDGDELRRTLEDLLRLTPMVQSIAAVPCGVTDYRQGLYKQTPYDAASAAEVIDILEEYGRRCKEQHGVRIIYPSDEWYLTAGRPIPPTAFYEDFAQLENGVGMWRLFDDEFRAELDRPHRIYGTKQMDVVTGTLAAPLLTACMDELRRQYPMIDVAVHPIQNNFFGGNVSVAGLVTATDIIAQCKGRLHSTTLGVPEVMLRSEKDMFLDSITVEQLAAELGVKVEILPAGGGDLARALLRSGLHIARKRKPASQT